MNIIRLHINGTDEIHLAAEHIVAIKKSYAQKEFNTSVWTTYTGSSSARFLVTETVDEVLELIKEHPQEP